MVCTHAIAPGIVPLSTTFNSIALKRHRRVAMIFARLVIFNYATPFAAFLYPVEDITKS